MEWRHYTGTRSGGAPARLLLSSQSAVAAPANFGRIVELNEAGELPRDDTTTLKPARTGAR